MNTTKTKKIFSRRKKDAVSGILMAILPMLGILIFTLVPQIIALWLSFQEAHSFDFTKAEFVGFGNFVTILQDPDFYLAIGNTVFYMIPVFLCVAIGLGVAILLVNKGLYGKRFFRCVFFIPYVCSVVATTLMWYWIFEKDFGILNGILTGILGASARVNWLGEEWPFRIAMLFMLTWSGAGYNIILYQAAIAAVDESLYEAASLDGANAWQKFRHVTLPAIRPTTFFMIIMGVINGLQAFTTQQLWGDQVGGQGPNQSALTVVYYIYQKAWVSPSVHGMGYASAASWLLAILIGVITLINFKVKRKEDA